MRVSYNWLKQYVDLSLSAEELGEKFTAAGLELDGIERRGESLAGVLVAKVLSCEPINGSDHLHLCRVDSGAEEPLSVVCGAPNVAAGQLVACATVGAVLPGNVAIAERRTFGALSQGMLCSQKELGLSEDHSGIWVLDGAFPDEPAPLGAELAAALHLRDQVLVIELTPNRSDCLGMLNCAREAAALTGAPLTPPETAYAEGGGRIEGEIGIEVKDYELCPRYDARVVKNVRIGPSPLWMQNYLLAAGMRPINNVVDISNFVMLEMNQPLHTFDLQRIKDKKIVVRAAHPGETMRTLDGKERVFCGDELLITDGANGERPICVAGVMGGLDTEVTERTVDILIESACFNPVAIRRAARRLGIPSEASLRFEKGVDIAGCDLACRRAAQLLVKYCGGQAAQGACDALAPQYRDGFREKTIALRPARVNRILGTAFAAEEIGEVMRRLGFNVDKLHETMLVKVPSYRQDIALEIDLIEEVARIKGFGCIPQTLPVNAAQGGRSDEQKLLLNLNKLCASYGLFEAVNYAFISPKEYDKLRLFPDHPWRTGLVVANPLSEEQGAMRQTLLPGLLNAAGRNLARRNLDLRFFETGMVFIPAEAEPSAVQPNEIPMLGLLLAGNEAGGWRQPGRTYDFYYLKGIVEELLGELGAERLTFSRAYEEYLHPGRAAEISMNGVRLGVLGELHPAVAAAYELSCRVVVAELALPAIFLSALSRGNRPHDLPKYPASTRDIAMTGPIEVAAAAVEGLIWESGGEYLRSVHLFDLYDQPPIPAGQRSLAYALCFRADERTLTDQEVDESFARIVTALQGKYGYQLR